MTSTSIYQPLKAPTYLYIKQHSITKLKYFGKTVKDPYQYNGSGVYWQSHVKKHGVKFIETIWVSEPYLDTSISEIALHFSIENNIIGSDSWANLILENGLDGGITTNAFKKGSIPWSKGKKMPEVSKSKKLYWENWHKNNIKKIRIYKRKGISDKSRKMYSETMVEKNRIYLTCPHCNKLGRGYANMYRWHFDNCKMRIIDEN